ncbi:protein kinase [Streptomyces sp. NPDC094143]|uniref:protein kinase domain-containing protein n=1 Tax=Streptomyces sp. NPDC094143 TaxID=3155310 RepID=UPI003318BA7F
MAGPAGSWHIGDRIADTYEIRAVLGEGGMGVVYRVRHLGWDTDLAVKSPLAPGMRDGASREQFIREAETWVGFGPHPHVCTCHYVRTLDGVPRLFVEYLDAGSLAQWIADGRLYQGSSGDVMARVLDIAIQAAWGLIHAHGQGVVHQDVKPANILLDSAGSVKITDFGLARAQPPVDPSTAPANGGGVPVGTHHTLRVSYGGMTRAYASPEQYARSAVGRRSDVWSFAVSVLEMIVGGITWGAGPAAGAVLAALRADGFRARAAGVEVPAALDDLLARCLRPDPAARPDMAQVAGELTDLYAAIAGDRYPRSLPRPGDLRADEYNNRALSLLDLGRADEALALLQEASVADPQHPEAIYNRGLLLWRSGATTDEQVINELEIANENSITPYRAGHLLARVHLERGDADSAAALIEPPGESSRPPSETEDLRRQLAAVRGSGEGVTGSIGLIGRIESDGPVELTADSRHAWSASRDEKHTVTVWELPTGRQLCSLAGHTDTVYCLALTSDGRQALTSSRDGTVRVWDVSDGHCLRVLTGHAHKQGTDHSSILTVGHPVRITEDAPDEHLDNRTVFSVSPVPGRRTMLSAGADDTVREWDPATGSCIRVLTLNNEDAPPLPADFVPFGFVTASKHELCVTADRRFILCSRGALIWLWEYATGDVVHVLAGHTNSVTSLCATPDGRYALSASTDATIRVWDLTTGRAIRTLSGHGSQVSSVRAVSDGEHAISHDHAARVWQIATGRCVRSLTPASSVGLTPDGRHLLHLTPSGEVHGTEWRAGAPGSFQVSRPRDPGDLLGADGDVAALVEQALHAKAGGDIPRALSLLREARQKPGYERASHVTDAWHRLYDHCARVGLRTVHPKAVFRGFLTRVKSVAITPDGAYAAFGTNEGIQLWDLSSRSAVRVFTEEPGLFESVCVTPDGSHVAATRHRDVSVWNTHSGELQHALPHPTSIELIHVMPDGQRLVSSDFDRTVRVWNLSTGQCEKSFSISSHQADFHWGRVLCVTPDGRHAVTTHNDGTLRLWELSTGWCVRVLGRGTDHVRSGCATGDGRHVVTADGDGALRVWDLLTGTCTQTLTGHTGMIYSVSATADDRHILSAGDDGTVRVWDLATGRCIRTLTGHTDGVNSVSITPDGNRAVTSSWDGTVRVWELDWDLRTRDLKDWRKEIEPCLGAFLARCTEQHGETPSRGARRPFSSKRIHEVWTDRDFELLWRRLTDSGYRGLRKEGVHSKLQHLMQATSAVDPRRLRPGDVKPYQAVILSNLAQEHAATKRLAAAVEANEQALGIWRHISATAPEASRHDLVVCLQQHAIWLAKLRRLNEALESNKEAVRHCRGVAEPHRSERLSQLMYNRYVFLCQAKRREETQEWLGTIRHEFAASTSATYLPEVKYPVDPTDRARLRQDMSTVRNLISHYENLPTDNQHRLPGRVVSLCTHARLLLHAGERNQAEASLNQALLRWALWMRQNKGDQCAPLAIGAELLDLAELLGTRMVTRSLRRGMKLPQR